MPFGKATTYLTVSQSGAVVRKLFYKSSRLDTGGRSCSWLPAPPPSNNE